MKNFRFATTLTALAVAVLAGCASAPTSNSMLDQARSDYNAAQANNRTLALAPNEMKQAGDALAMADAAFNRSEDTARVNQLAYLARQRVALAQETANRKASEAAVAEAGSERDKLLLAARTREADAATQAAAAAQRQASASQQQAMTAQQQAEAARQQAAAAQKVAVASQTQASDAEARARALEAQMRDLNAKKTDRGMVITMGDVLFDSGQAQLKPGAQRNIEKLGTFLKEYPQRKAMIEGYTDSTGSDSFNQALSARRAEAVKAALMSMGVNSTQLMAQGYGETHPVAGNDNASGRQMNRRVEIVLSDETGAVAPR